MSQIIKLSEIDQKITSLKNIAESLQVNMESFPALEKNVRRILSNIKMLEINISDLVELENEQD